jgi:hypothetical protein
MQLFIQTSGIDLTDSLKRQTYEKLDMALDRLGADIESISVHLIDINGPFLGGIDKACRIVVSVRDQESIVAEDIDASVSVVVDRTTDRLGVLASQRVDSLRGKRGFMYWWFVKE